MDFDQITQIPPENNKKVDYLNSKKEIREFAQKKMEEFGLEDWNFEFNYRFKRKIGRCKYGSDTKIELSGIWFDEVGMEKIVQAGGRNDLARDTILHEIAHALDYLDRGKSGHGFIWKNVARSVGADPSRTEKIPEKLVKLKASWYRECSNCGEKCYYYKKPTSERACRRCCEKHNSGKFSKEFVMDIKQNDQKI